jgi:hypothetical protein
MAQGQSQQENGRLPASSFEKSKKDRFFWHPAYAENTAAWTWGKTTLDPFFGQTQGREVCRRSDPKDGCPVWRGKVFVMQAHSMVSSFGTDARFHGFPSMPHQAAPIAKMPIS